MKHTLKMKHTISLLAALLLAQSQYARAGHRCVPCVTGPGVRARSPEIGPLYLEEGEPLRLRIFIDRSVVEVFANGRQYLTLRCYPSRVDSNGVSVFARGRDAKLVSLRAWQMRSIWPELNDQEGRYRFNVISGNVFRCYRKLFGHHQY